MHCIAERRKSPRIAEGFFYGREHSFIRFPKPVPTTRCPGAGNSPKKPTVSFIWDVLTYRALCHDGLPRFFEYENYPLSSIQVIKI
jgi:hypothetical protein